MAREFLRSLFGLRHYMKIRIGDLKDESILSFNLSVIEELLEIWKQLKGARNQLLVLEKVMKIYFTIYFIHSFHSFQVETDLKKKKEISSQITKLNDNDIPRFLEENESEINNFFTEAFRIVSRNRDKMGLISDTVSTLLCLSLNLYTKFILLFYNIFCR